MNNVSQTFYTGSPVDPSDLRYRDDFIKEAWEALQNSHVVLTDLPPKTGINSSIMRGDNAR
jgi:precorrin isomerase